MIGLTTAGPHATAKSGDTTLASSASIARLPGIAVVVATSAPQANAVAISSGGSRSRKSIEAMNHQNGTA